MNEVVWLVIDDEGDILYLTNIEEEAQDYYDSCDDEDVEGNYRLVKAMATLREIE